MPMFVQCRRIARERATTKNDHEEDNKHADEYVGCYFMVTRLGYHRGGLIVVHATMKEIFWIFDEAG